MTDLIATQAITAAGSGARFRLRSKRRYLLLAVIGALLVTSVLIDMTTGPGNLTIATVIETIVDHRAHGVPLEVIVWDIRLPIALMAILVGAMLGAAGAEMQTILNNPLADPFTLGISSAASFGAAVAIVLQINLIPIAGPFLVTANAFVLALSTSFVIYAFTFLRGVTSETMVLVGIALMFTFSALLSLMEYAATQVQLSQIVFWMMGSLSRTSWTKIAVCLAILAGMVQPYLLHAAELSELGRAYRLRRRPHREETPPWLAGRSRRHRENRNAACDTQYRASGRCLCQRSLRWSAADGVHRSGSRA